jgi:hypothetical protein
MADNNKVVDQNKVFDCSHSRSRQTALAPFILSINDNTNFFKGQKKALWYKWGRNWWVNALPYANFLKSYGIFDAVGWCCSEAYATECKNCGNVVYRGIYCNQRHFCPVCGNKHAWEQAKRVMAFLDDIAKKLPNMRVVRIIFTTPQILWGLDVERVFSGLCRVIKKVFKRYWRTVEVGYFLRFHWWHSGNPLLGPYPHVECVMLNYGLDRRTGSFRRLNSKISHSAVKKMYLKALKEEFGRILDDVDRINLRVWFYNFKKQRGQLLDRLYYIFRPAQHDVVKFFVETGRDWDVEPSEEAWLWELLTFRITRTRWFGFLSCSKRGAFKWRIKKLEKEWGKCPYCGAPLTDWVRVSAEELEDLLLDRPPPLR